VMVRWGIPGADRATKRCRSTSSRAHWCPTSYVGISKVDVRRLRSAGGACRGRPRRSGALSWPDRRSSSQACGRHFPRIFGGAAPSRREEPVRRS
jgi:hypothetical protein